MHHTLDRLIDCVVGTDIFEDQNYDVRMQQLIDLENQIQNAPGYESFCTKSSAGQCSPPMSVAGLLTLRQQNSQLNTGNEVNSQLNTGNEVKRLGMQLGLYGIFDKAFGPTTPNAKHVQSGFQFGAPLEVHHNNRRLDHQITAVMAGLYGSLRRGSGGAI